MTNDNDRALCAATASLLRATRVVSYWGFALSSIAGVVLGLTLRSLSMTSTMGFSAVALLGVLERYFALRLALDVGLFDGLASGHVASLSSLDGALQRLGLRRPPADGANKSGSTRPLDDRVLGTRLLMQRHGIVVACQTAMFLLALLTQDLR